MIRFGLHLAAFVFSFSLNVSLRASVELPKNCGLSDTENCSIQVQTLRTMTMGSTSVRLAGGATFKRNDDSTATVVRGTVGFDCGLESGKRTEIATLFGSVRATKGEFILEVNDNVVHVFNISGDLFYQPRGEITFHSLPPGFSVFMAPVGVKGVAVTGFPKPLEIKPMIRRWSSLYTAAEKSVLQLKIHEFLPQWRQAVNVTGPWYQDIISREIASQKARAERLARQRALREAENNVFRNMFRSRIFDP